MNAGDRVKTEYGDGTLLSREGDVPGSALYKRWFVKVDKTAKLTTIQRRMNDRIGLCFFEKELERYV